jgi:hypothetical protein
VLKLHPETKICATFKVIDWLKLRGQLIDTLDTPNWSDPWEISFKVFKDRIQERFLSPVGLIMKNDKKMGEGFTIMATLCVLIEFLEASYEGKVYTTRENDLLPFEYRSSKQLFKNFLTGHEPFKKHFTSLASNFYDYVRCGLLHEARTKGNWLIREKDGDNLLGEDEGNYIIYRTAFYEQILSWVEYYKAYLKSHTVGRRNFIRKLDDLCDIKHDLYFAYGSNIDRSQMNERLQDKAKADELKVPVAYIHAAELAELHDHQVLFNKKSKVDNTGKANIKKLTGGKVYGLLYEIDSPGLVLLDNYEKGYDKRVYPVRRLSDGIMCSAYANVYPHDKKELAPSRGYGEIIVRAMEAEGFPEDYRLGLERYMQRLGWG